MSSALSAAAGWRSLGVISQQTVGTLVRSDTDIGIDTAVDLDVPFSKALNATDARQQFDVVVVLGRSASSFMPERTCLKIAEQTLSRALVGFAQSSACAVFAT